MVEISHPTLVSHEHHTKAMTRSIRLDSKRSSKIQRGKHRSCRHCFHKTAKSLISELIALEAIFLELLRQRPSYLVITFDKLVVITPKNPRNSQMFVGVGQATIASIFCSSAVVPLPEITWRKYSRQVWPKQYFF